MKLGRRGFLKIGALAGASLVGSNVTSSAVARISDEITRKDLEEAVDAFYHDHRVARGRFRKLCSMRIESENRLLMAIGLHANVVNPMNGAGRYLQVVGPDAVAARSFLVSPGVRVGGREKILAAVLRFGDKGDVEDADEFVSEVVGEIETTGTPMMAVVRKRKGKA